MSKSTQNSNLPSSLFVLAVGATGSLILWFDDLTIRCVLSVTMGLLLVGGLEAVHQATHGNLFSAQLVNKYIGTVIALFLLLNFVRYRAFHANHHAHTATRSDPERMLYLNTDNSSLQALTLAPLGYVGFVRAVNASNYVSARLQVSAIYNSVLLAVFIGVIFILTALVPLTMFFVYWGPLALFTWFDFLLNQAEHYGMSEIKQGDDVALITNNLILPKPLAILFLYRNLHQVHHIAPKTPWHITEATFKEQGDRGIPFGLFFKRYMTEGPRLWGVR